MPLIVSIVASILLIDWAFSSLLPLFAVMFCVCYLLGVVVSVNVAARQAIRLKLKSGDSLTGDASCDLLLAVLWPIFWPVFLIYKACRGILSRPDASPPISDSTGDI
jgi:hypothetical protein